jgi:hypothetical protein
MATNDRFRANIKRRIEKSKDKTELFVKKLLIDIDASLVAKSPVDTGRFRANWILGNGMIDASTYERFEASNNAPAIMSIKVNGQTISITNSLPYASRLETGWSKQAPAGMVRLTLAEVNSMANKIGVSLRTL